MIDSLLSELKKINEGVWRYFKKYSDFSRSWHH